MRGMGHHIRLVLFCVIALMSTGCATKMERMQTGFLNQTDVELVQDGLATPLLLLDGLNEAFPENEGLLFSACQLNAAYGSILLFRDKDKNKARSSMAFTKAKDYIFKTLELRNKKFKKVKDAPYEEFITCLPKFKKKDVPYLYYAAQSWTMWIIGEDTWESKADVPKVEAILNRILELDDTYNYGMTHCLIGAIYTTRPAELGGQPEEAKKHFEKALEISEGKNLLIHVLFASQYCKLVYDRELHDKLLQQVLDADVSKLPKDLTMMNVLAKDQAQDLLEKADEYF